MPVHCLGEHCLKCPGLDIENNQSCVSNSIGFKAIINHLSCSNRGKCEFAYEMGIKDGHKETQGTDVEPFVDESRP
jgi:hypothetical protein